METIQFSTPKFDAEFAGDNRMPPGAILSSPRPSLDEQLAAAGIEYRDYSPEGQAVAMLARMTDEEFMQWQSDENERLSYPRKNANGSTQLDRSTQVWDD